jgi:hypothetical protein
MSLSELSDMGDLIAAIAVIISLIYLARQVRQANAVAKATAYREIHQDIGQVLSDVMVDPELHRIWRKGLFNGEQLTEEDREKLGMILHRIFGTLDYGHHSGWLDSSLADYVDALLDRYLILPAVQGWWSRQEVLQPQPFRSIVNSKLKEINERIENESNSILAS